MKQFFIGVVIAVFAVSLGLSISRTSAQQGPTPTPFPTLPPDSWTNYLTPNHDQLDVYTRQFDLDNCIPPCLWGMTPGQSRLVDLYTLVEREGFLKNLDEAGFRMFWREPVEGRIGGGIGFNFSDIPSGFESTRLFFLFQDDLLAYSTLHVEGQAYWQDSATSPLRFSAAIATLDSIPEIYVGMNRADRNSFRTNSIRMYFLFRREGVLLSYTFDFSAEWELRSGDVPTLSRTCPSLEKTQSIDWYFWDAEMWKWDDVAYADAAPDYHPTIDQIFGASAATFVQYFRAHPDGYLESAVSPTYYLRQR